VLLRANVSARGSGNRLVWGWAVGDEIGIDLGVVARYGFLEGLCLFGNGGYAVQRMGCRKDGECDVSCDRRVVGSGLFRVRSSFRVGGHTQVER
jgi:hypothetical protein